MYKVMWRPEFSPQKSWNLIERVSDRELAIETMRYPNADLTDRAMLKVYDGATKKSIDFGIYLEGRIKPIRGISFYLPKEFPMMEYFEKYPYDWDVVWNNIRHVADVFSLLTLGKNPSQRKIELIEHAAMKIIVSALERLQDPQTKELGFRALVTPLSRDELGYLTVNPSSTRESRFVIAVHRVIHRDSWKNLWTCMDAAMEILFERDARGYAARTNSTLVTTSNQVKAETGIVLALENL